MKKKYDLVQHAMLIYLYENKGKRLHNHAIQFSSFAKKMYCIYFRNNNIYDEPQLVIPTLLTNEEINDFELKMFNKNIQRVAVECLDIIHNNAQWHMEIN